MKIDVAELTIGMYVVELDRPWTETSFLFQGFRIRQLQEIRLLQQICKHVWVDSRRIGAKRQSVETQAESVDTRPVIAKVDFSREVEQANPAWHAARDESLRILESVKLGQELDVQAAKLWSRNVSTAFCAIPPPCSGWPA